jgi:hypothetical protein
MDRHIKNVRSSAFSRKQCLRCVALLLVPFICLFLNACGGARRHGTSNAPAKPVLLAEPNPVPAGDLDQPLGTTQITWNTGSGILGDLYVKVNRSPEIFLARGASGTLKINWIQFDSTYAFRLYAKKRSRVLARLDVTRNN